MGEIHTNFVFGIGNPDADFIFVREAPAKNENLQGKPFVDRAGQLLEKILGAINLALQDVYILYVLKSGLPENRDPLLSEVELCEGCFKKQIGNINPKLIVALGEVTGNTILRKDETLTDLRKKIHNYEGIDTHTHTHTHTTLLNYLEIQHLKNQHGMILK